MINLRVASSKTISFRILSIYRFLAGYLKIYTTYVNYIFILILILILILIINIIIIFLKHF